MDYKNSDRIKTLMKSIDETYNSTHTIKVLHANELLEEGSFDKSIETGLPSKVFSKISSDGIMNSSSGLLTSASKIVPELSII